MGLLFLRTIMEPDAVVLNVKIPMALDRRFRMEIAKRTGGRKGTVTDAVREAIEQWIDLEPVKEVAEIAKSSLNTPRARAKAVDTLGQMGQVAIPSLSELVQAASRPGP